MAFIAKFYCLKCRTYRQIVVDNGTPVPALCPECLKIEAQLQKDHELRLLQSLTPEQRLRRIEEILHG